MAGGEVSLDGVVYVCGGVMSTNATSRAERFVSERNAWEPIPDLHDARGEHGTVIVNGCLVVVGGVNMKRPLSSAERFLPGSGLNGAWERLPDMRSARSEHACVEVGD